jgi:hypothetical protein
MPREESSCGGGGMRKGRESSRAGGGRGEKRRGSRERAAEGGANTEAAGKRERHSLERFIGGRGRRDLQPAAGMASGRLAEGLGPAAEAIGGGAAL